MRNLSNVLIVGAVGVFAPQLLMGQAPAPGTVFIAPIAAARTADSILADAARHGFTGVALIMADGALALRKGYGESNVAEHIAFTPNTVVQIGSNTKDFTAVAILQLLNRKSLSLDDSLSKFFDNVPADKRAITVRQLLNHRSGLPGNLGPDFEPVTRSQLIANMLAAKLVSTPGTSELYSNLGFAVLAAIIELKSGVAYDVYVRDNILKPIGLQSTGYLLPAFDAKRVAHGYQRGEDKGTMLMRPHLADGHYWNLRGNGGMLSTVDDMLAFYTALFTTEKLLPTNIRTMRFPDSPAILAGSDMVNFFLYHREPGKMQIILATTTAETRAPAVEQQLGAAFGLARNEGRPAPMAPNTKPIELPSTPLGNAVREYLAQFNAGTKESRAKFLSERVVAAAGDTRTIEQRVQTMTDAHGNLGEIIPLAFDATSPTTVTIQFRTSTGDSGSLTIEIEASGAQRITSLRLLLG